MPNGKAPEIGVSSELLRAGGDQESRTDSYFTLPDSLAKLNTPSCAMMDDKDCYKMLEEMEPQLKRRTRHSLALPVLTQVLALRLFASGSFQTSLKTQLPMRNCHRLMWSELPCRKVGMLQAEKFSRKSYKISSTIESSLQCPVQQDRQQLAGSVHLASKTIKESDQRHLTSA
ncbi:hypothetical protein E2C01_027627 [Portunus trituberculatus]|uniref:Uncharacterized protein n=1 Tax=Portunus trituberculatus TaxID=210409 RepID=A0A5B7EMH1_PORTR|nr:hypothetical protein [Portunus trituberculatus]